MLGLTLGDTSTPPPRPGIYLQNLSTYYLVVRGSKKQQKRGWDYSNITNGETFLALFGVISPCTSLTCPFQKRPYSFLQFGQVETIHGHLHEKKLPDLFYPLFLQAEQKEDDEHFANHLQMYVRRTIAKLKKFLLCAEYSMISKFQMENIFSPIYWQILKNWGSGISNYYVKFKMWPASFYVNSLCFPNIFELNVGVRLYIISLNLHRDWNLEFSMLLDFPIFSIDERGKKLEFSGLGPTWQKIS